MFQKILSICRRIQALQGYACVSVFIWSSSSPCKQTFERVSPVVGGVFATQDQARARMSSSLLSLSKSLEHRGPQHSETEADLLGGTSCAIC